MRVGVDAKSPTKFISDIVSSEMNQDLSTKQEMLKAQTNLLWAADAGKLDFLDCPSCHRQSRSGLRIQG